jgi:hypothetical protein
MQMNRRFYRRRFLFTKMANPIVDFLAQTINSFSFNMELAVFVEPEM